MIIQRMVERLEASAWQIYDDHRERSTKKGRQQEREK